MDSCKRECAVKVDLLTGDDDEFTDSSSSTLNNDEQKSKKDGKQMLSEKEDPHMVPLKPTAASTSQTQCGGKACVQCEDLIGIGVNDW